MTEAITLTAAYLLDLVIGDPRWLPHPVRFMGWATEKLENVLRGKGNPSVSPLAKGGIKGGLLQEQARDRIAGIFLVMIIVSSTYGLFYFLNSFFLNAHLPVPASYPAFILFVYLVSTALATNGLVRSGKEVLKALQAENEEEARKKLGFIVGRDTKQLDGKGIMKAAIETLSENASDGIIAPMFYFAIGGLPLAMTYKAVNTLDSMVGYKNERYRDIGWAAARLDDIANYIPARITGVLIFTAAFILSTAGKARDGIRIRSIRSSGSNGLSGLNGFKIMLRDGRKHLSPNSGIPEAAMAGALGVRLGGPSTYGGVIVEKPYIGEEIQSTERRTQSTDNLYLRALQESIIMTKATSFLGFIFMLGLLYLRTKLWS
jgi:adenosylcobinamide-phosphate synthase